MNNMVGTNSIHNDINNLNNSDNNRNQTINEITNDVNNDSLNMIEADDDFFSFMMSLADSYICLGASGKK